MKKRRPRLQPGDRVKVVKVPRALRKFLGRVGDVHGVRGDDRKWQVRFRFSSWHEFHRHELKRLG